LKFDNDFQIIHVASDSQVDVGLHNNVSPQFHRSQTLVKNNHTNEVEHCIFTQNFMQFYKFSHIYYCLISTLPFNIELKLTFDISQHQNT
jgi:hypothetical protein